MSRFLSIKPLVALTALACLPHVAQALPAFPGAEGFGADTVGGRGGKVFTVTTLDDAGPGSLREAIDASGPRTVVFAIGGTIELKSPLVIKNSNLTIAGQTAPGGGITLSNYTLHIDGQDIVVRYIRSRLGNVSKIEDDAINIRNGARNVVLDHLSASWSTDEALSPSGDIKNITVQWCFIAESLNKSVHVKGAHGYGSLLRATGGMSLHHNVWAFHRGRNPRFGDNYGKGDPASYDFRNNIIASWGDYASGSVDGKIRVNYVDNYLKPGKFSTKIEPIPVGAAGTEETQFFLSGNVVQGRNDWTANNAGMIAWGSPPNALSKEPGKFKLVSAAFPDMPKVTTVPAGDLLIRVLNEVGANRPWRDAVDTRLVEQILENKGGLIDSQEDVGGWPLLPRGTAPVDSDGDGIPDDWEKANGLNPKDGSDGAKLAKNKSGYTNLEIYMNSLVAPESNDESPAPKKSAKTRK